MAREPLKILEHSRKARQRRAGTRGRAAASAHDWRGAGPRLGGAKIGPLAESGFRGRGAPNARLLGLLRLLSSLLGFDQRAAGQELVEVVRQRLAHVGREADMDGL